MLAVDTNVVVRLLTRDEPRQTAEASALFSRDRIWIAKTVLAETHWVLTIVYGFPKEAAAGAIRSLLGLSNVQTEDEAAVAAALTLTERGLDFADSLHLESRPKGAAFVSFDQALLRRAQRAGLTDVSTVSSVTKK